MAKTIKKKKSKKKKKVRKQKKTTPVKSKKKSSKKKAKHAKKKPARKGKKTKRASAAPTRTSAARSAKKSKAVRSAASAKRPLKAAPKEKAVRTLEKPPKAKERKVAAKPRFTPGQLQEIRKRLLRMLGEIHEKVEEGFKEVRNRDLAHISDESDIASDSAEGDLAFSLVESAGVGAAEIQRAIDKIDEGTYGICDISGEPINMERLRFLPWATRSIERQQLMEIRARRKEDGGELVEFHDATDGADNNN